MIISMQMLEDCTSKAVAEAKCGEAYSCETTNVAINDVAEPMHAFSGHVSFQVSFQDNIDSFLSREQYERCMNG